MKAAILVLSDPNDGKEEALGRLFNALATAFDFKENGSDVQIMFNGTGTRWIATLSDPEHPANGLFEAVKDKIAGVSCGCADVFGAADAVEKSGFDYLTENAIPGTRGLPSLHRLAADGYTVFTF
ncbi:DsrE family protein [Aliikangiella coralliicola]|uniref:DsrE family protein n=1 Tax=Aliikangiella coralliicola TaxID=2592383 RepID=A0A545UFC0_9GAMM|nr:DsrE family protein [Aliikangiella coralliicola]TQV88170.1 DsrE family protein [Aliikangiella coralliicola]